jgi:hypothetical protein
MDSWTKPTLRGKFPQLFSFALDSDITLEKLANLCSTENMDRLFYPPLSLIAMEQFEELSIIIIRDNSFLQMIFGCSRIATRNTPVKEFTRHLPHQLLLLSPCYGFGNPVAFQRLRSSSGSCCKIG